jgi:hypothetical protein
MYLQKIGSLLQVYDKCTYLTCFLWVLSTSHLSTSYDEADILWYKDNAHIVAATATLPGKLISDEMMLKMCCKNGLRHPQVEG